MRPLLKSIIAMAIIGLAPAVSFAVDTPTVTTQQSNEDFKASCNKAWMDKAGQTTDLDFYKEFGERYCACAIGKPLANDADIKKTARVCMTQTMVKEVMDTLEDKVGLDNLNKDQIQTTCLDKWKVLYPNMDSGMSKATTDYCQCTAPLLFDLNNKGNDLTDEQWYSKMDDIAATCSAQGQSGTTTTTTAPATDTTTTTPTTPTTDTTTTTSPTTTTTTPPDTTTKTPAY